MTAYDEVRDEVAEYEPVADVLIENHGTIFTFELATPAARAWVGEHIHDGLWMGKRLVVEHRYAYSVAAGMQADGLVIR
jgi:hypothetical protein